MPSTQQAADARRSFGIAAWSNNPAQLRLVLAGDSGDKPERMEQTRIGPPRGLTGELAAFAANAAVPPEARAAATRAIIDTVGVILAGRIEPAVRRLAETRADGDETHSLAVARRLRAEDTALIDGFAGHILDYDDVARHGHPSVVVVPALFAGAQRLGASGAAMLDAHAVAYEAWARLAACEQDAYHLGAWHPTPMLGVVAATAGLCALGRLDAETAGHALGLAASFASGVIANFGTLAKPLHAGRAAAAAVEALRFARAGITAAPDALESPHGLLHAISPRRRVDCSVASNGWCSLDEGLSVKRYPVCYASHRAIDGVLALAGDVRPEEVRAITAKIGPAPAATLRYAHPETGAQARFSLHHNLAAALIDGAVGFAQLTDGYIRRADVVALYPLTCIEVTAGDCPDQPGMAEFDRVIIELQDGRSLDSGAVRHPRGHARCPLSDDQLEAKFRDCARHGGYRETDRMLDALQNLAGIADMHAEIAQW